MEEEPTPGGPQNLIQLIKWIGIIIPRCTDSNEGIRVDAMQCVSKLYEVKAMIGTTTEGLPEKVNALADRLVVKDHNALYPVAHELSKNLAPDFEDNELFPFVEVLITGLNDVEPTSASGTCIVLNGVLRNRGAELTEHVPAIITHMQDAMKTISNEQTLNGALHSIRTLTNHHMLLMADELLKFDIPHDPHVVKMVQHLAKDANLNEDIMKHYIDILNNMQPYLEKPKGKTFLKEANPLPMHATLALGEMFEVEEMENPLKENVALVFGTLLLRIGSVHGIKKEDAMKRDLVEDSLQTFEKFLTCIKDEDVLAVIQGDDRAKFTETEFYEGFILLADAVHDSYADHVKDIVTHLTPFLSVNFDTQRITVAAIFTAFICHCSEQTDLLNTLINCLLFRSSDSDLMVKRLVLRGMGNVADNGEEETNKYSTTILSSLMSGVEDPSGNTPELTLEAMNALAKIMGVVDGRSVVSILVNICMKLRPNYESQNEEIRASAIRLFGSLYRFGDGPCKSLFYDQIHQNLVSLLLHLNDESEEVIKVSKTTLKQLGPLLQAEDLNNFLQQILDEDRSLQYGEFMHSATKMIISNYPQNVSGYLMEGVNFFKSEWSIARGNAAMFVGFLLGHLPKDMRRSVNVDHVCNALTMRLKDDNAGVRAKCAEAMSVLYDY
eukprot:NODE_90_length_2355_cov_91.093357_g69_i0.p1 GENE.NODE_90_length_2355_cov_91.093357_g69_i0~~NODE_90_length_2355_cov_91.093357_g69_i0.p1  ORF type:complete len:766 (-),score=168.20 NODE_90_length_2355_cov_91.093357_g69_i0:57-2057(-)